MRDLRQLNSRRDPWFQLFPGQHQASLIPQAARTPAETNTTAHCYPAPEPVHIQTLSLVVTGVMCRSPALDMQKAGITITEASAPHVCV